MGSVPMGDVSGRKRLATHQKGMTQMTRKRTVRAALLACAGLATLGLIFAAGPAMAKSRKVTRTLSACQNTARPLADSSSLQVPFSVQTSPRAPGRRGARWCRSSLWGSGSPMTSRDVTAFLVSPTGLVDPLVLGRGDTGDDFGTGATDCSGTLTTFTDTSPTAIGEGAVPFAGAFKPEASLSVFTGSRAAGVWRVVVSDGAPGDTGTLHAVSFRVKYRYKSPLRWQQRA